MDPFTTLHNGIESYLKSCACVKRAVGPGLNKNFIAFNKTTSDSKKDPVGEADLPLLMLEQVGGPAGINTASGYVTFQYSTNLMIGTGDMRLTVLNPILWAVFAAIASAQSRSALTALLWNNRPFVKSLDVVSAPTGLPSQEASPGVTGWTSVCTLAFQLGFVKSDLDQFVTGGA